MQEIEIFHCGKRIKDLREIKGYSVNKLANIAGISQSYLRSVELEDKQPTVEIISRVCMALNISLKDFFDTEFTSTLKNDELIDTIYKLSTKQRKALLNFLDTLI